MRSCTKKYSEPLDAFAQDILEGLRRTPKTLPSKYFYDEAGDRLFQQIMALPEYYLTRCETEILEQHKDSLLQAMGGGPFDLVELGAGDGLKTRILLEYFLQQGADFRFLPMDISGNALDQLSKLLREELPALQIRPQQGDYFERLAALPRNSGRRNAVLFLGSNIGNCPMPQAKDLLRRIAGQLEAGELLLTGFDLKKDPAVVLAAYNDAAGVTREFNLNLLRRINRELNADFDPEAFVHWATYNPSSGACESYLVSKKAQAITLGMPGERIAFHPWEAIYMELSQKYDIGMVEDLAAGAGFRVLRHFTDARSYFADSLWEKA